MPQKEESEMGSKRQAIVTTAHRGVFYGTVESYDADKKQAVLTDAVMAIYWGTNNGLFQLAATGPTDRSRISAKCGRLDLVDVTGVADCSDEAVEAWARYVR